MEKPSTAETGSSRAALSVVVSSFFSSQKMAHRARFASSSSSHPLSVSFSSSSSSSAVEQTGVDSDGNTFSSRSQLWSVEAGENTTTGTCIDPQKKRQWYTKGVSYWKVDKRFFSNIFFFFCKF